MILKFTLNLRISPDANVSVTSEQIVDNEREAEESGKQFKDLVDAFIRGYGSDTS